MTKIIESADITTEKDKYICHLKEPFDLEPNGVPLMFFEVSKTDDGSDEWVLLQAFLDGGGEIQNRLEMPMHYFNVRKNEYPEISEQLDMLYHAIDADAVDKTSDFYVELKKVKDASPKPPE